jgi:hypothetical protein
MHTDGQMEEHDEAIVAFRNFANAPKNAHDYSAKAHVLVKGNLCLLWGRISVL